MVLVNKALDGKLGLMVTGSLAKSIPGLESSTSLLKSISCKLGR